LTVVAEVCITNLVSILVNVLERPRPYVWIVEDAFGA